MESPSFELGTITNVHTAYDISAGVCMSGVDSHL